MDMSRVRGIRRNMEAKSTEELIQIWRENDRTQYVEEAFEAIRLLLVERGEVIPPQLPMKKEERIEGEGGGFFSFRTMVSTSLIKIIYVLGLIGVTIGGIVMIVQGTERQYGSREQILIGISVILLGNLLWRIVCEGWILLFSVHDILGSIERELKRK